jgi:uncharacterized protein (DUF2336 family)
MMLSFFKNLFSSRAKQYELQKQRLIRAAPEDLQALAEDIETNPEILYYLAQTGDDRIRRAVANNASTPVQAATLLAQDAQVDVRMALAARILDLLPGLSPEKQGQLYAYAVQVLGMLAQDEVLQVRRALTTVLRDYAKAPPAVVSRLARDVEREVSEPILRFCLALPDSELLDILSGHPSPWVVGAIAERPVVSAAVSDAVFETGDVAATTALVKNAGAALSDGTLQKIVELAHDHPEWHRPVAARPELSFELVRQMAGFVDQAVLSVLEQRSDFDPATRQQIRGLVHRRLEYAQNPSEPAAMKIARYASAGKMTPDVIADALAWNDMDFVELALAGLSGIHPAVVRKMLSAGTAKPVVALCWRAKLPMRLCIEVQKQAAHLAPPDILYAKGGTDYPLTAEEIKWQLEFFGVA